MHTFSSLPIFFSRFVNENSDNFSVSITWLSMFSYKCYLPNLVFHIIEKKCRQLRLKRSGYDDRREIIESNLSQESIVAYFCM